MIEATRYHDISSGHRVYQHESKCQHLHGHNYRVHFYCTGELDDIGRVIDFSVIKQRLCMWLEDNWDHHFLVWESDPIGRHLVDIDPTTVVVPFNPTAENMGQYLLDVISPMQLAGTGVVCNRIIVEETRKCSVVCAVE